MWACRVLLLLAPIGLAACAEPAPRCAAGWGDPALAFGLFFGRSVPGRADVGEEEWEAFVQDTLGPALPMGFTVFNARGAWFSPRAGRTIHEATKVLLAVLPDRAESQAAIARVRAAYQARFQQQLVGMTVQQVCGAF